MNGSFLFAAVLVALPASPAHASFAGQSAVAAGHSFVSSCSGTGFGYFDQGGNAVSGGTSSAEQNCAYAVSAAIGGTATVQTASSGAFFGYGFANDSNATASLGTIHLFAENNGSAATHFSGSQAVAGWNDSMTIVPLAGQNGAGIKIITLHVDGMLSSIGQGADSQFGIEVLLNHNFLQPYGPSIYGNAYAIFAAANSPLAVDDVFYGWDYQMKPWRETNYGTDRTRAVDQSITFAVPFIYNVPFTLGIYAQVGAGEASSGGSAQQNQSTVDFAHTISWGGKGLVVDASGLNSTTNFTITSLSGFNYNVNAVPEPGIWVLLLTGFGAIGAAARRHQAVSAA